MPNIDAEINNFKTAVLGEEVRCSLISLALKMNGIFDEGNELLQEGLAQLDDDLTASTQAIAQALACIAECNEILEKLTDVELTSDEALVLAQRMAECESKMTACEASVENLEETIASIGTVLSSRIDVLEAFQSSAGLSLSTLSENLAGLSERVTDLEDYIASVKSGSEEVLLGKGEIDLTEVENV